MPKGADLKDPVRHNLFPQWANLSLETKDSQVWAKLDLQLGPADGRRPGLPEAGGRAGAEPWHHQEQPHCASHRQAQPRRRGPAARARDARRRQDWLDKNQPVQELPDIQLAEDQEPASRSEQEDHEIQEPLAAETQNNAETSEKITDVIPQLDGPAETGLSDTAKKLDEKEPEPVVFKMLSNGFAETKTLAAGEKPPARVFHPELRIGTEPRQTEWGDRIWIEYVFEVDNVQMEMYQVI